MARPQWCLSPGAAFSHVLLSLRTCCSDLESNTPVCRRRQLPLQCSGWWWLTSASPAISMVVSLRLPQQLALLRRHVEHLALQLIAVGSAYSIATTVQALVVEGSCASSFRGASGVFSCHSVCGAENLSNTQSDGDHDI